MTPATWGAACWGLTKRSPRLPSGMNVAGLLHLPSLDGDLERVDRALKVSVAAEDTFLHEVGGHLINAGGKRFRPALVIAAAAAAGSDATDDVVMGGVAVELMHLGSLYHDDVMDDANTRRGVPSVNAKWNNLVAILAGDFLLGKASEIATDLGNEVASVLATTLVRMCEGQLRELQTQWRTDRSEAAYLTSIEGKTAALMAAGCRVGALTSHQDRDRIEALTEFGLAFGMAFQIYDDISDITRSDEDLGKPAGHDMEEGTYTLPVLRALADAEAGSRLRELLGGPITPKARLEALSLVRGTDGVAMAMAEGRRHADAARSSLAGLPYGPVRKAMGDLGHLLLDSLNVPA